MSNAYAETQDLFVNLLSALQAFLAARFLHSQNRGKTLFHDLLQLNAAVSSDNFDAERIRPLLDAILECQPDEVVWDRVYESVTESTPLPRPTSSFQQTPLSINTGSFANSTEHRKHIDNMLKEELGDLHVGLPGSFDAFFGDVLALGLAAQAVFDKCKEGDSLLFRIDCGWQSWPKAAKEEDILSWFAPLTNQLLDLADRYRPVSGIRRRTLAQPHQPLQGSTADRKLDIGFVDNQNAGVNSKCRWSHTVLGQKFVRGSSGQPQHRVVCRLVFSSIPRNTTKMRPFGIQISRNRKRKGELSSVQRIYILAQAEGGCGTAEIASRLGCSQRAVQKVIQRWETEGTYAKRNRMGRPPKITRRQHLRLLRAIKKDPKIEYSALYRESGLWDTQNNKAEVSYRTIQRSLARDYYRKYRARRRPLISAATAKKRRIFARRWRHHVWDGPTVLKFSDECSIARGSGHNAQWVWRLPSQKWARGMIEPVSTARQPTRMVWAAIWVAPGGVVGRSPLVVMTRDTSRRRQGYTTWSYIHALEEGLLPQYLPGELFMQDNAPIHNSRKAQKFLESHGIATIEWPPYSLDLNPIENLWWALKKKLHELYPQFDYMGNSEIEWDMFEVGLAEAWAAIPDTLIAQCISSMPRRLNAVLRANGFHTKY